jgi:hypothetical protein
VSPNEAVTDVERAAPETVEAFADVPTAIVADVTAERVGQRSEPRRR